MAIDFGNINSILNGFDKILKLTSVGSPPKVPPPLIYIGVPKRTGLSATKIASRIISRKNEAGLPVGNLPSGTVSPDEIMERIRIEEIINALHEDAVITITIAPGITLTAAGVNGGGPMNVIGSTIVFATGYGVIQ